MIHNPGHLLSIQLGLLCLAGLGVALRHKAEDFEFGQHADSVDVGLPVNGQNRSSVQVVQVAQVAQVVDSPPQVSRTTQLLWSDASFVLSGYRLLVPLSVALLVCFLCYFRLGLGSNYSLNSASDDKSNQRLEAKPMVVKSDYNQSILVGVVVIGVFVATEVGRTLLVFQSLGRAPYVAYDPSAVVLLAEAIKFVMAAGCVVFQHREVTWQEAMRVFWPQCGVGGLFAIQNNLNLYAIVFVGPMFFCFLGQCKILSTCLFMWVLLGRKFSGYEQAAILFLIISVVLPQLGSRPGPLSPASDEIFFSSGVVLVLVAGICSGLSAVMSEKILKDDTHQIPFMVKNAMAYVWGILFNSFAMAYKSTSMNMWFDGFGVEALSIALLLAGTGLSIAWILKYFDNLVRSFASIGTFFLTTLCSMLLFGKSIDIWVVSGTIIFGCAIVLYSYEPGVSLKTLKLQGTFAACMILVTLGLWSSQLLSPARTHNAKAKLEHDFTPGVARDILGAHEYYEGGAWLDLLKLKLTLREKELSTPGTDSAVLVSNLTFHPRLAGAHFIPTEQMVTTESLQGDFWYVRRMNELELADKIMPASSKGRLSPPDWQEQMGKYPGEVYSKPSKCTACFDDLFLKNRAAESDVNIGTDKHIMMDEWMLDHWENVRFEQLAPSQVHDTNISNVNNVKLHRKFFGNVLSVAYDDASDMYKIWLQTDQDTYSVFESSDMIQWMNKKPIDLNTTTLCVTIDPHDPLKEYKFKAVYECDHFDPLPGESHWQKHKGGMKTCLATSPDGVHFTKLLEGQTALPSHGQGLGYAADSTSCLTWDSKRQVYSLTNRAQFATHKSYRWRDIRALRHLHLNGLIRNETANSWKVDSVYYLDKAYGHLERYRRVMYGFSQFEYAGLYIGIATVLEYPRCLIDLGCKHCKRRAYITTSRDGVHYDSKWIYSDVPLKLPKLESDTCPNGVCQYQAANRMISRGAAMFLPFIAISPPHNPGHYTFDLWSNLTSSPNRLNQVHIAEWPLDRLVGLSVPDAGVGRIVTKPFVLKGTKLWLNLKVLTGSLRVVVRSAGKDNSILKSSELMEEVDEIKHGVQWGDGTGKSESLSKFLNSRVALSFEFRGDATLFSFQFSKEVTTDNKIIVQTSA